MAKIRNITDKNWKLFEKGRLAADKSANAYFSYLLCNQSNDKLLQALKQDLNTCVNEFGILSKKNKKLKNELKKIKAEIKELKAAEKEILIVEE